jgi:hypothetical protein
MTKVGLLLVSIMFKNLSTQNTKVVFRLFNRCWSRYMKYAESLMSTTDTDVRSVFPKRENKMMHKACLNSDVHNHTLMQTASIP